MFLVPKMKQISSDAQNKSYDVSSPGQRIRISAPCFNSSSTRMLWLLIWCSSISFLDPVSSTTTTRPVGTSTASETTFRPDLSTRDVDEDLAVVFQDLDDKLLPLVARIKHDKGISGECQLAMLKTTFAARSGDTWALKRELLLCIKLNALLIFTSKNRISSTQFCLTFV